MTGFVGHMKNCIKQNRSQLNSKNAKFRDNVDLGFIERNEMQFKEVSEEKLKSIKEDIRIKAEMEQKRILLISLSIFLVLIIACLYFL
ncbi:hypothetical protein L3049_10190 [Labilibaculum sp. DW002]|uniref:Uncharacterized protein n=1 Tax=Paralabilibaculum antarcticum TaxID=2912572 RepID=A0ABT5VVP0_9BACT|nr:hypothetical protein [Labilibaculum sp. DW002]MDE5418379.1 hypothetical protein [Labilibaculum sp. DW002]